MSKSKEYLDRLAAEMPPLSNVIRGSLLKYYHEGCKCHPKGRYGPYWYLSVKDKGKTKMYKLPDDRVPFVREAVENYRRWKKISRQITDFNTRLCVSKEP